MRAFAPPRVAPPTRNVMLRGLIVLRWATTAWAVAAFVWEIWRRDDLDDVTDVAQPGAGLVLLAAVIAVNAVLTLRYRREPRDLLQPPLILVELAVGAAALYADVWVYGADHGQVLPSIWPVCGVAAVALAAGARPAVVAGLGLGIARYGGWLVHRDDPENAPLSMSRTAQIVLLGVAGWTAAYIFRRLSEADRAISTARAREEVARTLHDGVLQTLAVIQRRSDDGELKSLARDQERDLRDYLFATPESMVADGPPDLGVLLRTVAGEAERRHGLRVQVVLAPDLDTTVADDAIAGAVREALTNAARHGGAANATVYAEPAEAPHRVFASVKDDGAGFDPGTVTYGEGIGRSIRGRIEERGGRVEIASRPGRGADVRLWL